MSAPNYAERAYEILNTEIPGECEPELLTLYTLLMLTKGTETTLKDVHDAWGLWRMTAQPSHKSLVPFHQLTPEVQELDRPYMDAIHRAARVWQKSVQNPERGTPQAPAPPAAEPGRSGGAGRTWRIEFPPGQDLLNANQRRHWANKAAAVRQLRYDAFLLAKHHKVPHLERAHIEAVIEPADRRRRDDANWQDTAKAATDGLVDAGVLSDDDTKHLVGPHMRISDDTYPGGRLVLIITELAPATEEPE